MLRQLMTRVTIALIFLIAIGIPVSVRAQTRLPAALPRVVIADDMSRAVSRDFVLDTIRQARMQLDLARLVSSQTGASDSLNLSQQAQKLWTSVDNRLHVIAEALKIPAPVGRDAQESAELGHLQMSTARSYDLTYARLVMRACNALLERMDRLDPQINSRLLFFVDDMLPKVERLQMSSVSRVAQLKE